LDQIHRSLYEWYELRRLFRVFLLVVETLSRYATSLRLDGHAIRMVLLGAYHGMSGSLHPCAVFVNLLEFKFDQMWVRIPQVNCRRGTSYMVANRAINCKAFSVCMIQNMDSRDFTT
jgi:hypothetical protein